MLPCEHKCDYQNQIMRSKNKNFKGSWDVNDVFAVSDVGETLESITKSQKVFFENYIFDLNLLLKDILSMNNQNILHLLFF